MILYINSSWYDIGQQLLYAGLVKLLGKAQVLDYPRNDHYHDITTERMSPEGEAGTELWSVRWPWNQQGYVDGPDPWQDCRTDAQIVRMLQADTIKLIIVAEVTTLSITTAQRILDAAKVDVPLVLVEARDYSPTVFDPQFYGICHNGGEVLVEFLTKHPPDVLFKREMTAPVYEVPLEGPWTQMSKRNPALIHSLTFCGRPEFMPQFWNIPLKYRPLDATFRGYETSKTREMLNRYWMTHYWRPINRFLPNYLHELTLSKVGVTAMGTGMDSQRTFEIPLCGAVMLREKLPLWYDHPFVHGETCLEFNGTESDFRDKLLWAVSNEDEAQKIADAGREHVLKYHTPECRARKVLQVVKEQTGAVMI